MKRFLTQIGKLFTADSDDMPEAPEPDAASRLEATLAARRRSALIAQQKAAEREPAEDSIPFAAEPETEEGSFGTRVEDMGPGKTVLRTSYLIDPAGNDESLSLAEGTGAGGAKDPDVDFDPYNSGQFDRSRNWSKHPRR